MKSILLIGGTGVLSSAIANEALRKGYSVTMVNRGSRKPPAGAEVIVANKNDYALISEKIKGLSFDAIIDFLCYTVPELRDSFKFYSRYTKQYFFISSCAVYAPKADGYIDEDSPKPNPTWKYSVNKWDCEIELMRLAGEAHCNYTIIRPAVTYGDTRIPYGIAPKYGYHWTLVERVKAGKPILTWNGGNQLTYAMRVEDFAVGALGLVGNERAYNQAFNICADGPNSFMEVLDAIGEFVGKPVVVCDVPSEYYARQVPHRAGEILGGRTNSRGCKAKLSNMKLKEAVPEFKQRINLHTGVLMTLEAYRSNNFFDGIDWEFDGETDRIVREWLKLNRLPRTRYNTKFMDYLSSARLIDRYRYWRSCNQNSMSVKLIMKGWRIIRKFI